MQTNRSLLNGLGALASSLKANEVASEAAAKAAELKATEEAKAAELKAAAIKAEQSFSATCPKCGGANMFNVDEEEVAQDFDFSCDSCGKQSPLSQYVRASKVTAEPASSSSASAPKKAASSSSASSKSAPKPASSSSASSSSGVRKDKGEVKTINLEPHWPGMVRYFHANPDQKFWKKTLTPENDANGWFAAVASAHPDKAIAEMGRNSPTFKGQEGFAGLKEHLASLGEPGSSSRGFKAGIDDNEDDRRAYQSAVRKRQAKLKPHSVCPQCKTPKKPGEPCTKCGNDPELGDYLGTFLGEANPAASRMLALLKKAGVVPRVIGLLRKPVTVEAAEEGDDAPDIYEAAQHLLDLLDEHGNIDPIRDEGPIQDLRDCLSEGDEN